jgi:hypothetical protein
MKLSISKLENNKYQDEISASITPKKAAILVDIMPRVEAGEEGVFGTTVGMSEVQTAVGFQNINDVIYFRIAKVDKSGRITDQRTFTFPSGSDASLRWSDFEGMKFTKDYNDMIDYNMFKEALADFARGISGAYGYGTIYMNRYHDSSITTKVNSIMDKLGIPVGNKTTGGYFNNNGNSNAGSSQHRSYEDISAMISDEDDDE